MPPIPRKGHPDAAALLCLAGTLLYGERWKPSLAKALGTPLRTLQRWAYGEYPPPPQLWAELRTLLHARQSALAGLVKKIHRGTDFIA
jgi:hypothetical protein